MSLFYTKEQVVEQLVNLLTAKRVKVLTNTNIHKALTSEGFSYKSFSDNSIDCYYYGKRIRVKVKFTKDKGVIPIDITYYPR